MPLTSTESRSRCRQCGAPLVGAKRRRACPRCHPEAVVGAAQMEFSLGEAMEPVEPPMVEPVDLLDAEVPDEEPGWTEGNKGDEALPEAEISDEASHDAPWQPDESALLEVDVPDEAPPEPDYDAFPEAPPEMEIEAEIPAEIEPEVPAPEPFKLRPRWSIRRFLSVAAGSLIVAGGLSWAGFQLWPSGRVERSIVQALEALPRFVERTGGDNPCAVIAVEGDSSPAIFDLDGDGLLDLVSGSRSGDIRIFRNTGTRTRPRFTRAVDDPFGLAPTDTANTIAFAELRGNGLTDALNAGTNGSPTFFQNRGTRKRPEFVLLAPEDDPFATTAAPAHSFDWRASFADIDHDRDADLFVGTRDGTILFFENRGTAQKPYFQGVTRISPFGLRGVGELVSLSFGDLDGDGDLDAVAGNATGELLFLHNRGNPWRPKFAVAARGSLGLTSAAADATVALADLDGDGDLDCLTGGADGKFRYFENLSTPVPAPTPAH